MYIHSPFSLHLLESTQPHPTIKVDILEFQFDLHLIAISLLFLDCWLLDVHGSLLFDKIMASYASAFSRTLETLRETLAIFLLAAALLARAPTE